MSLSLSPGLVYDTSPMPEREPRVSAIQARQAPEFGHPVQLAQPATMFPDGVDLPLFSGTPIPATQRPFVPEDHSIKQASLPGMPAIDYDAVLAKDKALRRRRHAPAVLPPEGDIFVATPASTEQSAVAPPVPPPQKRERRGKRQSQEEGHELREALAPYVSLPQLRRLAAAGENLTQAFTSGEVPKEVQALLETLTLILRPTQRDQIKSPYDLAALLMVEMGYLEQEQMRVACLDTKNRLQKIHIVYQGSLDASPIRVGEIFREPLRLNSASIILAHNHPSGEANPPSPEDVLVTREIVKAGELLGVEVLDHLVIGQGTWVSMRERGLGFTKPLSRLT
jgi:DNA repair protein RadC